MEKYLFGLTYWRLNEPQANNDYVRYSVNRNSRKCRIQNSYDDNHNNVYIMEDTPPNNLLLAPT